MRPISALVALVLAVLMAACSGDGGGTSARPAALLAAAIAKSEDADAYRLRIRFSSDIDGDRHATTGRGVSSADTTTSRLTWTTDGEDADPFAAEVLTVDGASYQRGGLDLPEGKRWMRLDDPDSQGAPLSPEQFLAVVRDVPQVTAAGKESVRGTTTTHLRAPLDTERLEEVGGVEGVVEVIEAMTEHKPSHDELRATAHVWVDEQERIVRDALGIRVTGREGAMRIVTDYLERGVALGDLERPDPRTVVDEDEVAE